MLPCPTCGGEIHLGEWDPLQDGDTLICDECGTLLTYRKLAWLEPAEKEETGVIQVSVWGVPCSEPPPTTKHRPHTCACCGGAMWLDPEKLQRRMREYPDLKTYCLACTGKVNEV